MQAAARDSLVFHFAVVCTRNLVKPTSATPIADELYVNSEVLSLDLPGVPAGGAG